MEKVRNSGGRSTKHMGGAVDGTEEIDCGQIMDGLTRHVKKYQFSL